jgi:hypothetical protein
MGYNQFVDATANRVSSRDYDDIDWVDIMAGCVSGKSGDR